MFERMISCDWSKNPQKRILTKVDKTKEGWLISATEHVGDTATLLSRARKGLQADQNLLLGFDFPIGLPAAYANLLNEKSFRELLPKLGLPDTDWLDFFNVCQNRQDISLHRPFYPDNPGGRKKFHLLQGLNLQTPDQLLRDCESTRPVASPLFWVLGAQQVGKAAISGWREILQPMLGSKGVVIYPFDGELVDLSQKNQIVIAEIYPALSYRLLGLPVSGWKKRNQEDRRAFSRLILDWCCERKIEFKDEAKNEVLEGFGSHSDGEDRFDSFMGSLMMIEVESRRRPASPKLTVMQSIFEGWMLGKN